MFFRQIFNAYSKCLSICDQCGEFTKNGTITLQFEVEKEKKNRVLFAVADTGCGIPKEKQKQVFERFEKLNEYAQGTGLGLSICKLTVDKWGGDIWIDPDYEVGRDLWFRTRYEKETTTGSHRVS